MTPRPPAPDPLPLPVVDNHTHLGYSRSAEEAWDVGEALAAAAAVNVTRVVTIGCEPETARSAVVLAERYPTVVAGVALHPTEAARVVAEAGDPVRGARALADALAEVEALAGHPRVRVVGETGLDHHWVPAEDHAGRAAQEESFRWHIDLAKRLGRVLQIHDREAHPDILRVLHAEGAPDRTVLHCFSGDAAMAKHCVDQGWYVSFAGTLTFRNAEATREALRSVPLDRVLVETDAPYLAPVPHRGRPNSSYLVPLVVRGMAEVLDRDLVEVCAVLDRTADALYGPW